MGKTAVALPVGILAGLCVAMFIFIWWWFPRHYRKGITSDMREVDEARANREREAGEMELRAQQQRDTGRDGAEQLPAYENKAPKLTYVPPVAGY